MGGEEEGKEEEKTWETTVGVVKTNFDITRQNSFSKPFIKQFFSE